MQTSTSYITRIFILITLTFAFSCNSDPYNSNGKDPVSPPDPTPEPPVLQKSTEIRDLVLIYGGGAHRTIKWTKADLEPYVMYKDGSGNSDWMFDGFLFLEIHSNWVISYATGYGPVAAKKEHWQQLADYFFSKDYCIGALNDLLTEKIAEHGAPKVKRKVVIGAPEPISTLTSWGLLDNKQMDFRKDEDRIAACKWYVEYVEEKFKAAKLANLELAGFYWIAEETGNTKTILKQFGKYLEEKNYSFNWIPWWKSPGYNVYKDYGFSVAYLQPNYFFNSQVPYSRLQDAYNEAKRYNINLELEFDENVLGGKGERLDDYLNVFQINGVFETMKVAYYQGESALSALYKSRNASDKKLYKTFSETITKRQKEENPPYIKK